MVGHMPLHHSSHSTDVVVEGRVTDPGQERIETNFSVVAHAYFTTAGTSITRGRAFTENDTASSPPVVIVNETFARRYWPGQNPIGKRLREASPTDPFLEVIGVAADGKYQALFETPMPYLFLPYAQRPATDMMLLVSHRGDEAGVSRALREAAAVTDPAMPLFGIQTMGRYMAMPRSFARGLAAMVLPGAILAAVLAALGLYGVLAHAVSRRTREVGIRMAVGAHVGDVVGFVLRQGLGLSAVGVVIGLALAFATTRLLSGLLWGISATDPLVFVGAPVLLMLVAAVASYVPTREALKIDPLQVLRQE